MPPSRRRSAKMRQWAETNGYQFTNQHHEIYLGDPRRAEPEKLKTVLRHGVKRKVDG